MLQMVEELCPKQESSSSLLHEEPEPPQEEQEEILQRAEEPALQSELDCCVVQVKLESDTDQSDDWETSRGQFSVWMMK